MYHKSETLQSITSKALIIDYLYVHLIPHVFMLRRQALSPEAAWTEGTKLLQWPSSRTKQSTEPSIPFTHMMTFWLPCKLLQGHFTHSQVIAVKLPHQGHYMTRFSQPLSRKGGGHCYLVFSHHGLVYCKEINTIYRSGRVGMESESFFKQESKI